MEVVEKPYRFESECLCLPGHISRPGPCIRRVPPVEFTGPALRHYHSDIHRRVAPFIAPENDSRKRYRRRGIFTSAVSGTVFAIPSCIGLPQEFELVKIRQVDVASLDKPTTSRATRELTPKQRERQAQQRQLTRMLSKISDRDSVFEVRVEADEKPLTIRQRLMRAADDAGKE